MTKNTTEAKKNKKINRKTSSKINKNLINSDNWSLEEDSLLLSLFNILGSKWKFISKYFPDKSLMQIYNRYFRINPNIKKGRFSDEEDAKILECIKNYGFDWKKIAQCIGNRNPKQIRTRYKLLFLSNNKL